MADEIKIRLTADDAQAMASLKRVQSNFKNLGSSLNQVGNIASALGANQFASLINQTQMLAQTATAAAKSFQGMKASAVIGFTAVTAAIGAAYTIAMSKFNALEEASNRRIGALDVFLRNNEAREDLLDPEGRARREIMRRTSSDIQAVKGKGLDPNLEAKAIEVIQARARVELEQMAANKAIESSKQRIAAEEKYQAETKQWLAEINTGMSQANAKLIEDMQFVEMMRLKFKAETSTGLEGIEARQNFSTFQEIAGIRDRLGATNEANELIEAAMGVHYQKLAELSKDWYDNEQKRAKIDAQQRLQIQTDFAESSASIMGSMASLARLFGREGFIAWKAFAVAQAVISGANAVLLQLSSGDPYTAPFRATAAGVAAAVQIATIIATEPQGYMLGGYTGAGGRGEVAGTVHRGEYVMPAPTVERLGVANLDAIRAGAPNVNVGSPNVSIAMINSRADYRRFLQTDPDAERWVIDVVSKNRLRLGI